MDISSPPRRISVAQITHYRAALTDPWRWFLLAIPALAILGASMRNATITFIGVVLLIPGWMLLTASLHSADEAASLAGAGRRRSQVTNAGEERPT
jgi:hypothetical protein